ncbi:hypothetical protein DL93DRAFT_1463565 [Clavulina sp. PMI_390]|nr:hypothetical protein DL93DRAFT_1463565 [Clavulina sp. PMI_390]
MESISDAEVPPTLGSETASVEPASESRPPPSFLDPLLFRNERPKPIQKPPSTPFDGRIMNMDDIFLVESMSRSFQKGSKSRPAIPKELVLAIYEYDNPGTERERVFRTNLHVVKDRKELFEKFWGYTVHTHSTGFIDTDSAIRHFDNMMNTTGSPTPQTLEPTWFELVLLTNSTPEHYVGDTDTDDFSDWFFSSGKELFSWRLPGHPLPFDVRLDPTTAGTNEHSNSYWNSGDILAPRSPAMTAILEVLEEYPDAEIAVYACASHGWISSIREVCMTAWKMYEPLA